jgi:hypothetical protein
VSTGTASAHDWAVRQLLAYSAGLLPEAELTKLEEHLHGCPECRSRLAPLKPAAGTGAGHLPASLIATWSRSAPLLEGLERELVETHLEDCGECRDALSFAGVDAEIPPEPAPDAEGQGPRTLARSRTHRIWVWALALSGAAAGVAAWLFAAHPAWLGGDGRAIPAFGGLGRVPLTFEFALDSLTTGACRCPSRAFARRRRNRSTSAR